MEEKQKTTLAKDKMEFVSSILTNKKGNVMFFRRRDDLELDPGKYDFCSGHIKEGEAPIQAMYRELNEEIGIKPEQVKLTNIGIIGTPHKDFEDTLTHIYYAETDLDPHVINDMITKVKAPELSNVVYVENIKDFITYIKIESQFRMEYTKQLKYALEAIEQRMNKTKEEGKDNLCEEK